MAERSDDESARRSHWWLLALIVGFVLAVWMLMMPRTQENATQPALANSDGYQHENPEVAFEPSDWKPAPVAMVYVGVLILLVVSCFVLMAAYPNSLADVGRTLRMTPPGPLLQTDPQEELRRLRAEQNRQLNDYYWVDKSKGVVHIPIEQAMKNLVRTGIPGFPKEQQ